MSNRRCPKCGEEYSDTYRSCPFCEEEEAIKRGHPPRRRSGRRVEKRQSARTGGAGGVMLLLTGIIILGVVGYVVFGDDVADAVGIRDTREEMPAAPRKEETDPSPAQAQAEDSDAEPPAPSVNEPAAEDEPDGGTDEPDPQPEPAGPLTLSQTDISIPAGETGRLTAAGGSGDIVWTSSNPEIASVDGGAVTGKAGGTVTITATCGEETAVCQVKVEGEPWVNPNAANISLNKTDFTFYPDEVSPTLRVKGTDSPVTWSSADTSVATVDENGVVKWAGRGTTTVTASVDGVTLECIVRARSR